MANFKYTIKVQGRINDDVTINEVKNVLSTAITPYQQDETTTVSVNIRGIEINILLAGTVNANQITAFLSNKLNDYFVFNDWAEISYHGKIKS
jgi:hypothetical protein